jgi:hypothetical protein
VGGDEATVPVASVDRPAMKRKRPSAAATITPITAKTRI